MTIHHTGDFSVRWRQIDVMGEGGVSRVWDFVTLKIITITLVNFYKWKIVTTNGVPCIDRWY